MDVLAGFVVVTPFLAGWLYFAHRESHRGM